MLSLWLSLRVWAHMTCHTSNTKTCSPDTSCKASVQYCPCGWVTQKPLGCHICTAEAEQWHERADWDGHQRSPCLQSRDVKAHLQWVLPFPTLTHCQKNWWGGCLRLGCWDGEAIQQAIGTSCWTRATFCSCCHSCHLYKEWGEAWVLACLWKFLSSGLGIHRIPVPVNSWKMQAESMNYTHTHTHTRNKVYLSYNIAAHVLRWAPLDKNCWYWSSNRQYGGYRNFTCLKEYHCSWCWRQRRSLQSTAELLRFKENVDWDKNVSSPFLQCAWNNTITTHTQCPLCKMLVYLLEELSYLPHNMPMQLMDDVHKIIYKHNATIRENSCVRLEPRIFQPPSCLIDLPITNNRYA